MSTAKSDSVAKAIMSTLVSPNVCDSNLEAANVVDALDSIAKAIFAVAKAIHTHGEAVERAAWMLKDD